MDRLRGRRCDLERLFSVPGLYDPVPGRDEAVPGELAHISLIVNDEDCLHARSRLVGRHATPQAGHVRGAPCSMRDPPPTGEGDGPSLA